MSSSVPNPWWQTGGNDDDLRRNSYAEENEEYDVDIISTTSSMYVDENSEDAPMTQTLYESDRRIHLGAGQRQSRDRYAQQLQENTRKSSSGGFRGRKELIEGSMPASESARKRNEREQISSYPKTSRNSVPSITIDRPQAAKRYNSRESSPSPSGKKKVRWTCKACTYSNVTEFIITSEPKITLNCEMCSTPNRVRVNSNDINQRPSRNDEAKEYPEGDRTNYNPRASSDSRTEPRSSSTSDDDKKRISKPRTATRTASTGENTLSTSTSSTGSSSNNNNGKTTYSMSELIKSLGTDESSNVSLPAALERRVQDFRFAQNKRREKHGDQSPWGIYGLYAHLSDIRADLEWSEDAAWRRHRGEPYLSWRDFDESRDKGLHNRPLFTYGVMVLCTVMMFVTLGVNGWRFEPLNVNPLIGPSSETLIKCGARDTNLIVNEGQWYRLFTPMVLHAGVVHYLVNMLALYFIGGAVEKAHGFASAAVLFIVPSVGGNILSAICLPGFISVGASGGIFGLIGGCMADICLNWNLLFLKTTTDDNTRWRHFLVLLWLAVDIIVNCLLGFTPFVDNFTHLGGFLYGFCIGFASIEQLALTFFGVRATGENNWYRFTSTLLRFFGLIVSIIAIMATTIVLVKSDGVTSPCPGCRYISCVPFPPKTDEKWWYCDDCDIVTADIFQSIDGTGRYEQVNINCPNGEVEEIFIEDKGIYDKEELRRLLPSFCRSECEEVFGTY